MAAYESIIARHKSERWDVKTVVFDGESAIKAITQEFNQRGIRVDVTCPGQHVSIAENKIRQIKDRARSIINSLHYRMPQCWVPELVKHVVQTSNLMLSGTAAELRPAREIFNNQRTNVDIDLPYKFGQFLQAVDPSDRADYNGMESRTRSVIYLRSTGHADGSCYVLDLNTSHIIARRNFVEVPITPEVILRIRSLDHEADLYMDIQDKRDAAQSMRESREKEGSGQ